MPPPVRSLSSRRPSAGRGGTTPHQVRGLPPPQYTRCTSASAASARGRQCTKGSYRPIRIPPPALSMRAADSACRYRRAESRREEVFQTNKIYHSRESGNPAPAAVWNGAPAIVRTFRCWRALGPRFRGDDSPFFENTSTSPRLRVRPSPSTAAAARAAPSPLLRRKTGVDADGKHFSHACLRSPSADRRRRWRACRRARP